MNGKDKERSFSEVGDTLRYFNAMASSHSWCGPDSEDQESTLSLVGLNKLDMPLGGASIATAAAKAIAVAATVSCDDSSSINSVNDVEAARGGIKFIKDLKEVNRVKTNEQWYV